MALVVDPALTEEKKAKLEYCIFDITKEPSLKHEEEKRILSMTVQYRNLRIDNNSSFFAHCLIYIDGLGVLRKKLIDFDDLDDIREKRGIANDWFCKLEMPPESERFVKVRTGGNFTMALSTKGELWSRGWDENGQWTEEEKFKVLPRFRAENGMINSSLGPSPIKDFVFDALHVLIMLENGAVFVFGNLQDFSAYDREIPTDGFIEITDSSKYKPKFVESLCGSVERKEGKYGIFGTHKPVKYFRRMAAFLTDEGIPIIRIVNEVDRKNQFFFTPLSIDKFFGGQKIVNMNHHMDEMYITNNSKCYIVNGLRGSADILQDLIKPKLIIDLGFSVTELKASILTKHSHVTFFRSDGSLLSRNLERIEEPLKKVNEFSEELTEDEKNPHGMVLKWYGHCALSYYFLFE